MTSSEKKAVSTAYDFFKNPGDYPIITNPNTPEQNALVAGTIDAFFEIDDEGNVIEINQRTVEKFNNIAKFKGVME